MVKRNSDKVYQSTEQERHRCEVAYVAKQGVDWIKTHLSGVQEKRGFEAYKKLRDDVEKIWKRK
jgi:hypothetical protein